jgi:hypothetical protein
MLRDRGRSGIWVGLVAGVISLFPSAIAQTGDPHALIAEADGLVWLKAWSKAAPLFAEAEKLFTARGDRRRVLYAQINQLRARLPSLPVPEVSARLAEYLADPMVQTDERLRLRCLVIKGETDEDLDSVLAGGRPIPGSVCDPCVTPWRAADRNLQISWLGGRHSWPRSRRRVGVCLKS